MGNRAIYIITENGDSNSFYVHLGANALSPLLRLLQAKEIQEQLPEKQSISHIFEHLDYNAAYVNPRHDNPADMFCEHIDYINLSNRNKAFEKSSMIEMLVILDIDNNNCLLEYNPNSPWYATMGSYSIPLDVGLNNVKKLLNVAKERNINDFGELLSLYNRGTGLDKALERAQTSQLIEEYLNSDKTKADRERFTVLYGDYGSSEEENEMEV